jgi:calcium-binding protein CML
MDELRKVFDQFDANKDGRISLPELGSVLQAMGSSYSDAELRRVMVDVDTDSDGFINLEEFALLCKSPSSELKDAFDLYDQDKNGLISSKELHLVLNSIGMTCSVDDCVKMIVSVDADGDGNVNFEEFQKMMSANLVANGSN